MTDDRLDGPAPEPPQDTLGYVAASVDDIRRHLDAAQSAASTALAWVRIQQMRSNEDEGDAS